MAVTTKIMESKLKLNLNMGADEKGEAILKAKTYSNISSDAVDSDLYDVGETIGALQESVVDEIIRINQVKMIKA